MFGCIKLQPVGFLVFTWQVFGSTQAWDKHEVRSLKFIWASCAQLYSLAETPQPPPPPPAFGLIYEGAIGHPINTTSLYYPLKTSLSL
jgi:hypothetical protein